MVEWRKIIEDSELTDDSKSKLYSKLMGDEGGRDPELNNPELVIDKTYLREIKDKEEYHALSKINHSEDLAGKEGIKLNREKGSECPEFIQ